MYINHKLGAAFENAVDEVLAKAEYDDNEADNAKSDFRKVYNHVRDGISEIGIAEDIPKREKTIEFYNTVKNLLDKGLPVSCSTYNNRKDMLSDERHAYSLIGAVETDGVPKRYFFRIKKRIFHILLIGLHCVDKSISMGIVTNDELMPVPVITS